MLQETFQVIRCIILEMFERSRDSENLEPVISMVLMQPDAFRQGMHEAPRTVDLDNFDEYDIAGEVSEWRLVTLYPALDDGFGGSLIDDGAHGA